MSQRVFKEHKLCAVTVAFGNWKNRRFLFKKQNKTHKQNRSMSDVNLIKPNSIKFLLAISFVHLTRFNRNTASVISFRHLISYLYCLETVY